MYNYSQKILPLLNHYVLDTFSSRTFLTKRKKKFVLLQDYQINEHHFNLSANYRIDIIENEYQSRITTHLDFNTIIFACRVLNHRRCSFVSI